jgi:hypothetical protein
MLDITGPKVSVPTILFALLSPGLIFQFPNTNSFSTMNTSTQSILFHSLVFLIVYNVVAQLMGVVLTKTDLIVTTGLFILLSPGMVVGNKSRTSIESILVHSVVFACVFALLRKQFPQYY